MDIWPRTLEYYVTNSGRIPFKEWYSGLRDDHAKVAVRARLTRIERGLLGDCKSIGDGVYELRIFIGPGYRIYLGFKERASVILLCGGDKSAQTKDICRAKLYWQDYLRRIS